MHCKKAAFITLTPVIIGLLTTGCSTDSLPLGSVTAPPYSSENQGARSVQPLPSQPTQPSPKRDRVANHTVVAGDSLWKLSRQYDTTVKEIQAANNMSDTVIRTGTVLKIPTNLLEQATTSSAQETSRDLPEDSSPSPASSTPSWESSPPIVDPGWTPAPSNPQYRIPEPDLLPPPSNF